MTLPSYADAPFHAPADIVIDLPPPVSTNRLWLIGKGDRTRLSLSKSRAYARWIKCADDMLLEFGQLRGVRTITGNFTALIVVKRSNLDLDNNAKGVLDFLQSRNFIVNDKYCEELTLRWGDAPTGCRVTVRPCA